MLGALHVGAVGGICALANAMPKAVWQLSDLFSKGELAAASDLQRRLVAPNQAVTKIYGVSGMKRAMDLFGFYGGPTRRPLLDLNESEEKKLQESFKVGGFL